MTTDIAALADRLDSIVRDVPGVASLYSASPAVITTVRQIASGGAVPPSISITAAGDAWEIVASIGVLGEAQGPQTAAAVSAAILAELPPQIDARVRVRISRIIS